MSNRCVDCKFHYSGYEWDEVDEENYLIDICVEGHTEYIESSEECQFFQEYERVPYVEKYTKCDKCELLHESKEEGRLIETTALLDNHKHYIMGCGYPCKERLKG